jgi:hypothetical protein
LLAAFSGVLNGDFEDYEGTETTKSTIILEGSTHLTSWTVEGLVVRIISGDAAWQDTSSASGDFFIGLTSTRSASCQYACKKGDGKWDFDPAYYNGHSRRYDTEALCEEALLAADWCPVTHFTQGGSIFTLLSGMQIGSQYSVTWSERDCPPAGDDNQSRELTVKIGGCSGVDISSAHTVPDVWETKHATFVATAASTVLCFFSAGGTEDVSVFLDAIVAGEGTMKVAFMPPPSSPPSFPSFVVYPSSMFSFLLFFPPSISLKLLYFPFFVSCLSLSLSHPPSLPS